jgi:hypothetical protein
MPPMPPGAPRLGKAGKGAGPGAGTALVATGSVARMRSSSALPLSCQNTRRTSRQHTSCDTGRIDWPAPSPLT